MDLRKLVEQTFAAEGSLAKSVDGFMPRQGQTDMALAVTDNLTQGGSLVVEAGTGVGKTFAYLVPVLLSGERVLVCTATKALQDQLYGRDLPRLLTVLGVPVTTALLKGRASYLCLHRMSLARHDPSFPKGKVALTVLAQLERWARVTRAGDLAELPDLDEQSEVIPWATSTRENCLGQQCPSYQACHVNSARRAAMAADVVVINHHLFFADMMVRESGVAEILPTVRAVVFDEAHQLNDIGVQFLGETLSTGQFRDYFRDVYASGLQSARGLVDWQGLHAAGDLALRALRFSTVEASQLSGRLRWQHKVPEGVDPRAWGAAFVNLTDVIADTCTALDTVSEIAPDFVRLFERGVALTKKLGRFAQPCPSDGVRWLDIGMKRSGTTTSTTASNAIPSVIPTAPHRPPATLRMVESPLDISDAFRRKRMALGGGSEREQSWIFTSATLGTDDRLSWFTQSIGLTDAQILRVSSPFDYMRQAALYVPGHLPLPADVGHSAAVAALAARAVTQLAGRTLVLTTTLRALRTIGDALSVYFEPAGSVEVLVQGQWPKRRLMERFRAGTDRGQRGCVLVAAASFWEGFDVPGDALQLVIVDKLPFPPPHDPLVEARSKRLESQGRNAFNDYFVPEAAIALKQGTGRLIRQVSDRGVLIVCDTRLVSMGYGRRILGALPAMRRLNSDLEMDAALAALAELAPPCQTLF